MKTSFLMAPGSRRIGLERVVFTWAPLNVRAWLPGPFRGWAEADGAVRAAADALEPGEVAKTYFEVMWQDRRCHRGRLDLVRDLPGGATPLSFKVRFDLAFFAGRHRPASWSDEQYWSVWLEHLTHTPTHPRACAQLLDGYELGL